MEARGDDAIERLAVVVEEPGGDGQRHWRDSEVRKGGDECHARAVPTEGQIIPPVVRPSNAFDQILEGRDYASNEDEEDDEPSRPGKEIK